MKNKNIISLPTKHLEALVRSFCATKDFNDLMIAVEFAVDNELDQCNLLLDAWRKHRKGVRAESALQQFSKILPKIFVSYTGTLTSVSKKEGEGRVSDTQNMSIMALGKQLGDYWQERQERFRDKYSWFETSLYLGDILQTTYPEKLNPGIIIGHYLKCLFPEAPWGDEIYKKKSQGAYYNQSIYNFIKLDNGTFYQTGELIVGSPLHTLIDSIGKWSIDQDVCANQYLKTALDCILYPDQHDSLPFKENIQIEDLLESLAKYGPDDFIAAWFAHYWLVPDDDFQNSPDITDKCLSTLLRVFQFGEPALENELLSKKYLNYEVFGYLCNKISSQSTYIPDNEEITRQLINIINNYTEQRRENNFNLSFISKSSASDIFNLLNLLDIPFEYYDLTMMISIGQFESSELFLFESQGGDNLNLLRKEVKGKQKIYLLLFDKSLGDGMPELANSLLSLFLFSLAIYTKGRLINLSFFDPMIRKGLSLPGSQVLKYTLKIVADFIDSLQEQQMSPSACLASGAFRSYLPRSAELHSIKSGQASTRKSLQQVEEGLKENLGENRWEKLSTFSQNCLRDAELTWQRTAMYFGAGLQD